MGDKRVTDRCYNNLYMRCGKKELDMIRLQVIEVFLESNMSHSYLCKMWCLLNLVLENWEYLWFY